MGSSACVPARAERMIVTITTASPTPFPASHATPAPAFLPEQGPMPSPLSETLTFAALGVQQGLCRALEDKAYTRPTPIQAKAIPLLLEGRDLLGIAQTGTGKTAAFAIPVLQSLGERRRDRGPRALVLAPTRELAIQIAEGFRAYGARSGLMLAVIFGGVSQQRQVTALRRGADIVIATPGRLLDLIGQGHLRLDAVRHLVLDEADRMLDMGFIRDIRKILALLPKDRQSLLFSATMPEDVSRLAADILREPARVDIAPKQVAVSRIRQSVHFVEAQEKLGLLCRLLDDAALQRVIVFTRTKHRANRVAEGLAKAGIEAEAIHGNKSQGARQRALDAFRQGTARVLVATEIAARGIDVAGVSHVVNFELPNEPESYVHRIGRTARAGTEGVALSFCDATEVGFLRAIEALTRNPIAVAGGECPRPARPPVQGKGRRAQPNQGKGHRAQPIQPARKPVRHRRNRPAPRKVA